MAARRGEGRMAILNPLISCRGELEEGEERVILAFKTNIGGSK